MKVVDFNEHLFRCSQLGKLMVGVSPALTANQEKELSDYREKVVNGKITDKQLIKMGDLIRKKKRNLFYQKALKRIYLIFTRDSS